MPPMFKARFLAAFLLLAFAPAVAGQRSTPADVVATDRLARIDKVMQQYVDDNRIPGAVALVLRDGRPIYDKAFGWSDKETNRKMATDSIFRIASQSKALTSVAILILRIHTRRPQPPLDDLQRNIEVAFQGGVIDSIHSGQHTAASVGEGASGDRAAIISPQRRGPFASQDGATAKKSIASASDSSRCNGSTISRLTS